jgi:hypothetical protein
MITRRDLYRIAEGFVDHFLASYVEPPEVIVLDFDDTEDVVHGHQQLALFSGFLANQIDRKTGTPGFTTEVPAIKERKIPITPYFNFIYASGPVFSL